MSEPIVLHMLPMAEAARYLLDNLDDIHGDVAGRVVALTQIAEDLIAEIPDAEARGYDRAIANLRNSAGYHAHQRETGVYDGGREFLADWLESIKEDTAP